MGRVGLGGRARDKPVLFGGRGCGRMVAARPWLRRWRRSADNGRGLHGAAHHILDRGSDGYVAGGAAGSVRRILSCDPRVVDRDGARNDIGGRRRALFRTIWFPDGTPGVLVLVLFYGCGGTHSGP